MSTPSFAMLPLHLQGGGDVSCSSTMLGLSRVVVRFPETCAPPVNSLYKRTIDTVMPSLASERDTNQTLGSCGGRKLSIDARHVRLLREERQEVAEVPHARRVAELSLPPAKRLRQRRRSHIGGGHCARAALCVSHCIGMYRVTNAFANEIRAPFRPSRSPRSRAEGGWEVLLRRRVLRTWCSMVSF